MKNIISLLLLTLTLHSYGQSVTESWYQITIDEGKGYLHFTVDQEDSLSLKTALEIKIKVENTLISFSSNMTNDNDLFLTSKSFHIKGTADDQSDSKEFKFSGVITQHNDELHWELKDNDDIIITKKPTIVDWNLYHILTTLDYSKKGKILEFNSMEISELNYKENHYLEYTKDEVITINGKEILTKKIIQNGDGIGESSYYLDAQNNLVKISIDNYKNYIKCKKEDIDFAYFEQY